MPLLDEPRPVTDALRRAAELTVFQTDGERAADSALSVADAARFLGAPDDAVRWLLDSDAVPTISAGEHPALAYHDVAALALNSGLGTSVPEMGLAMMMRFVRQTADALLRRLDWTFTLESTTLPETGAVLRLPDDGATITALSGAGPAAGGWRVGGQGAASATVTGAIATRGELRQLRDVRAGALFDQTVDDVVSGRLRFQWIGAAGRRDPHARRREGRIDCVCLAAVLQDELRRLGLRTRIESGRVLGLLDARHTWVGIHEDGMWKRFDPLLASHCHRLWGPDREHGAIFRGSLTNALVGWPGAHGALTTDENDAGAEAVEHTFVAQRVVR